MVGYSDLIKKKATSIPKRKQPNAEGNVNSGVSQLMEQKGIGEKNNGSLSGGIEPNTYARGVDAVKTRVETPKVVAEQTKVSPFSTSGTGKTEATDLYSSVSNGADPYEALLKSAFEENEASLKRRKKAALLGDIAQLFGRTVSFASGARQFAPLENTSEKYSEALEKLRGAYNANRLNYTLNRLNEREKAKSGLEAQDYKFRKEVLLADIDHLNKMDRLSAAEAARYKRKVLELEGAKGLKELEGEMRRREMVYKESHKDKRNTENANARMFENGGGTTVLGTEDGNEFVMPYKKNQQTSIISLYDRVAERILDNPSSVSKQTLRYVKSGKAQGNLNNMMAVINQTIRKFPELTKDYMDIVNPRVEEDDEGLMLEGFDDAEETQTQTRPKGRPEGWNN